jgi:lipoprotein signal peptidase
VLSRTFDSVKRHITPLLRVALLVAIGDLLTKQIAVVLLTGSDAVYATWLRLTIVHNDAGALGFSFGAHTFAINVIIKTGAILLMLVASKDLARIDPDAPLALGFIVGAALGNLASLLVHPAGVVDFIAIATGSGRELVLNAADIAAYVGLAMLGRTAWRVFSAARSPARAVISERLAGRPIALRLMGDREIVRSIVTAADARPTEDDELWVPRQKQRIDRTVIPVFDERPRSMGAIQEEQPRGSQVIDLRTRRAAEREVRREI